MFSKHFIIFRLYEKLRKKSTKLNKTQFFSYIAKKAIRLVSLSDYLSHTDPIFKELKLLTLEDMFTLQKFKFLHKLAHNTLPTYFDTYKPFLTRLPVVYNLRPHALALPRIYHVYAESCLVYQLVKLYNDTTYDPLILRSSPAR